MRLGAPGPRLLAAALLLAGLIGCGDADQVSTFRVERRDFVKKVTADGNLRAKDATVVSVPTQVRSRLRIAWLASEGTRVVAGDVVALFDASDIKRRLDNGENDLATSQLRISKAEVESEKRVAEISKDRVLAGIELDVARRFQVIDDEAYSSFEIIESSIDGELAEHRERHAKEMETIQRSLSRTEIELLEIDRRRAQLEISEAESGLQALELRAPHGGILTWIRDWRGEPPQVGGQVWRGQELAQIPNLGVLEVEAFVLEADAGGLEAGQRAEVVVEARPEISYPATVRHVSAVANPRNRDSPVQYFGATLEMEPPGTGPQEQPEPGQPEPGQLKPGQRVRVTLLLEERSDALVIPRQAVFEEGGAARVYIADGAGFAVRPVTLGAASLGMVVVEQGLEEGDVIALEGWDGSLSEAATASKSGAADDDAPLAVGGLGG